MNRKLLLILFAVLATLVPAHASSYLIGDINGVNNWSNDNHSYNLDNPLKITITTKSWFRIYSQSKNQQLGPNENDYIIPNGTLTEQSYGMSVQKDNAFMILPGTYTISYNDANSTVTVKKETTVYDPTENKLYYLYGDINGVIDWKDLITTYKLKSKTNGTFERNYVIIAKSKLRVSDGTDWYAPDTDVEMARRMSDNGDGTWTYSQGATKGAKGAYVLEPGLYTFNFNPATAQMTITELGGYPGQRSPHETQDYTWLYYNACAWGAYSLSESDPYIYCQLLTDDSDFDINSWTPSNGQRMVRIVEQVYGCKVPSNEIANYKNVGFYFNSKKGFIKQPASKGEGWDKANWTKFIYGNGANSAIQSYVTFDDFVAARRAEKTNLWVAGEYYTASDGTQIEKNWEPLDARKFEASHGDPVYYLQYTTEGEKGTRFKITWMDVKSNFEKNHEASEYVSLRGWATFNLGIIGPNPRDGFDGQDLEKDFDVALNQTHLLNNYTQFNFAPEKSSNKRYVVIDMHPECESFSLLDFDPNPVATVTPGEVQKISLDGKCTQFDGDLLKYDKGNSGRVYFPEVNKVDGKVNIAAKANNTTLAEAGYDITYDVYMNGRLIGRAEDANVDVNLEYIPYGAAVKVAARAEYADKETGRTFHSKVADGAINCDVELKSPMLSEHKAHLFSNADGETYDAAIACTYKVEPSYPDNDGSSTEALAVYADYRLLNPDGKALATFIPWADCPTKTFYDHWDEKPFEDLYLANNFVPFKDGADYHHATNNWAVMVTDETINLPVYMEKATPVFSEGNAKFEMQGYAVYPFLVKKNVAAVTVANAPRRAQAVAADFNPADYEIMLVYKNNGATAVQGGDASNLKVEIGTGQTTGIADIMTDADATAPVEYFNLQGVRIMNPVAGQVVIRRQGTTATKIMVK